MTEVDLGRLMGQRPQLTPEGIAAHEAYRAAQLRYDRESFGRAAFFGPVICACEKRRDPDLPAPPQMHCPVPNHGTVMMDNETGKILMFGIPRPW